MNVMKYATANVRTVAPQDSIDRAISVMEEQEIHHLVGIQKDRVVGMVSDRDILISTGWMLAVERQSNSGETETKLIGPRTVGQIMSRPAICIDAAQSAEDAARLLIEHRIGALPVLNQERLVGIVSDSDLIRWLNVLRAIDNKVERFLKQPVSEQMRNKVVTVSPQTLLVEVTDIFRRRRIRHVPVTENGVVRGIISDRDVRRSLGWSGIREIQAERDHRTVGEGFMTTAREILQTNVCWITSSAPMYEALHMMMDRRIHSLPIIDLGRLVGILTQTDFIKAIAHREML